MRIFNSIILICTAAMTFTACVKDRGNYAYTELNTLFVDTSKFDNSFVVRQNEVFTIDPVFMSGVQQTQLKYEWRVTKIEYAIDPSTGKYLDTVISKNQKLSEKLTFSPGSYILRLHVFDPANGNVAQIINTPLTISPYALSGLMLLHGDATSSDISTLINSEVSTFAGAGVDSIQRNIFSIVNGKKIEGEGQSISFMNHGAVGGDSRVYTLTATGGYRVDYGSFKIMENYNQLFLTPPPVIKPKSHFVNGPNEFLVNNEDVYFQGQVNPVGFIPFGVKCFISTSPDYKATAFIATDIDNTSPVNARASGIMYDQWLRRFLIVYSDNTVGPFSTAVPNPAPPFRFTGTSNNMIYAEDGFSPSKSSPHYSRYYYAVMQDPFAVPVKRKVFIADFGKLPDPAAPNDNTRFLSLNSGHRAVSVKDISAATDMVNAKYFAFGNKGNIMYYATDAKVYISNDYITSTLFNDVTANYPGHVISSIKVFKVKGHPKDGQLLHIALYDGTQSTLLQVPINPITGAISGTIKSYKDISGKISAVTYKPF